METRELTNMIPAPPIPDEVLKESYEDFRRNFKPMLEQVRQERISSLRQAEHSWID